MTKSIARIVLSHVFGFVIFLVLLAIANMLTPFVVSDVYELIVIFLDFNVFLFFVMMVVGLLNEIFWSFYLPFCLFAPIISSLLSVLIVIFFYRVLGLVSYFFSQIFFIPFVLVCVLVFVIVLFSGYLTILVRKGLPRDVFYKKMKKRVVRKKRKDRSEVDWKNVGEEFKLFFYNLGKSMNTSFKKKKK